MKNNSCSFKSTMKMKVDSCKASPPRISNSTHSSNFPNGMGTKAMLTSLIHILDDKLCFLMALYE